VEKTPNGIDYSWHLTKNNVSKYQLFPILGCHLDSDVRHAMSWIHKEKGIVRIYVEWKEADQNTEPQKLPDRVIVKTQHGELVELRRKIEELEKEKKVLEKAVGEKFKIHFSKEEMDQFKKDQYVTSLKNEITNKNKKIANLEKDIQKFRNEISQLVIRLNSNKATTQQDGEEAKG